MKDYSQNSEFNENYNHEFFKNKNKNRFLDSHSQSSVNTSKNLEKETDN